MASERAKLPPPLIHVIETILRGARGHDGATAASVGVINNSAFSHIASDSTQLVSGCALNDCAGFRSCPARSTNDNLRVACGQPVYKHSISATGGHPRVPMLPYQSRINWVSAIVRWP